MPALKGFRGFRVVRKVVPIFSALWTVACVAMFWSMHNSSRAMIILYVVLGGVFNALLWVLFMISWYLEKMMAPRGAKARHFGNKKRGDKKA
jgi:hypothetical protein